MAINDELVEQYARTVRLLGEVIYATRREKSQRHRQELALLLQILSELARRSHLILQGEDPRDLSSHGVEAIYEMVERMSRFPSPFENYTGSIVDLSRQFMAAPLYQCGVCGWISYTPGKHHGQPMSRP